MGGPYPHAGLGEVGPHRDLFARTHVGVAVPLEGRLQLLQLLAGEVGALPPLLLLQRAVFRGAAGQRSRGLLRVWGPRWGQVTGRPGLRGFRVSRTSSADPSLPPGLPLPDPTPRRDRTVLSPTPSRGCAHHCALDPCSRVLGVAGGECPHLTARGPGSGPPPR